MKFIKRGFLVIALFCVLAGGLFFYLERFTSSPQDVVEEFFDAYNRLDIRGMAACMEPGAEQLVTGSTELASSILNVITGVDLDLGALIDVMPVFANTVFDGAEWISVQNVHVTSYTPAFAPELVEPLVEFIPALVNILAEDAVVAFQIGGIAEEVQLEVIDYGADGWRIPLDAELFPKN